MRSMTACICIIIKSLRNSFDCLCSGILWLMPVHTASLLQIKKNLIRGVSGWLHMQGYAEFILWAQILPHLLAGSPLKRPTGSATRKEQRCKTKFYIELIWYVANANDCISMPVLTEYPRYLLCQFCPLHKRSEQAGELFDQNVHSLQFQRRLYILLTPDCMPRCQVIGYFYVGYHMQSEYRCLSLALCSRDVTLDIVGASISVG
jgi:hypothetical protein